MLPHSFKLFHKRHRKCLIDALLLPRKKTFKRNLKPVFGPTKKSQNQMDSSQKRFNLETLMNEVNAQFHAKKISFHIFKM